MARMISKTIPSVAVIIAAVILTRGISDAASAKPPPYVVKILIDNHHVCDGSIIAKDIIMSDSECIKNTMPTDYEKESPYWVLMQLFVTPFLKISEEQMIEGKRTAWDVSRIIYRDKIALLKLRLPLPEDFQAVELFSPDDGLKMFENATAYTADNFFRRTRDDKYHNASSVILRTVPPVYCQDEIPVRNSSQICLRAYPPYYSAYFHGGPVILRNRQLAIVAPVEDAIHDGGVPFPHYAEFATYPSIIGVYDWIKSTMKLLAEDMEVTNPQDYDIYIHL